MTPATSTAAATTCPSPTCANTPPREYPGSVVEVQDDIIRIYNPNAAT